MEVRSKLGTSLGYRELFEGRLNAVIFLLVGISRKRPQKLVPGSGGAAGQLRCFDNQIAIANHQAVRIVSQVPSTMQTNIAPLVAARA